MFVIMNICKIYYIVIKLSISIYKIFYLNLKLEIKTNFNGLNFCHSIYKLFYNCYY